MRPLFFNVSLVLIPIASFATTDTLAVLNAVGLPGERVEVQIALANDRRVAGAQLDLVADGSRLRWGSPRCVERAMGMEVHSRIVGDTLRIVMIDPGRRAAVAAGSGPVLVVGTDVLAASGEVRIGLGGAKVSDDEHPPQVHDAAVRAGRISILPNLLSVQDGGDMARILLLNADRVAAAQFDLVYDPAAVSVSQVGLTSRCAGMSAFDATVAPGRTRVVLADVRGGASIPPGEGPVAEVFLRSRRASTTGAVPIQIEGAVLSGPGGTSAPVGARGGTVSPRAWSRPRVVIDEALADPPDGPAGDANGDGRRDGYEDEFVEILNADTTAVDLSGWALSDDDVSAASRFRFPQGTVLRPGERAVLFGGGRPTGVSGLVFVDDGRVGDGLANAGDRVLLIDAGGTDTIAVATFGGAEGQSLVRQPEESGAFVPHGAWPGRGAFSPGRSRPVASGLRVSPEAVTLRPGQSALLRAVAVFTDGVMDTVLTGLVWSSGRSDVVTVEGGGRVTGVRTGSVNVTVGIRGFTAASAVRVEETPPAPPAVAPPAAPALNRPPVVETASLRPGRAGVFYREQVVATDADGDRRTFSLTDGPVWLGIDAATGVLSGRPGREGEVTVGVQVEDGRGERTRKTYRLRVLPRRQVVIDEALADPPVGLPGDANGDGRRDGYEDEFVEILNADTTDVDVSGWTLGDDDASAASRFRFPLGTVLHPGERAVLFGGGRPKGAPRVFVDDGRIGDGLSNAGEKVLLLDVQEGDTVDVALLPKSEGQSLARYPEGSGAFVPHGAWPGRGAFSPGRSRPVASGLRVSPETVTLRPGQSALLRAVAVFTDGVMDTIRTGLAWSSDRPEVVAVEGGGRVSGLRIGAGAIIRVRVGEMSAQAQVSVEAPPNRPPMLGDVTLRPARAGVFYREQVVATDADGDRLTFSLTDGPVWLGIDAATGVLSGRPGRETTGEVTVGAQVEDGRGERTRKTYRLRVLPRRQVVIDEALADPPDGLAGDANGDGRRDGYEDEFVEILNADTTAVDVSGWTLSDDDASAASRFRFPLETVLRPGERAVLFGGGRPKGAPRVFVDDGRIGDGLSNAGEKVLLLDVQEGDTVDVALLPKSEGQSLARYPEGSGAFVPHGAWPGRGAFSPGRSRPLLRGIASMGDDGPMRPGERRMLRVMATYSDSSTEEVSDFVIWVGGDTAVARLDSRSTLRAVRPGQTDFVARWDYVAGPPYRVKVVPFENRPPAMVAVPDTAALEDSPFRLRVRASDPDGDEVRFALVRGPAWLSVDPGSGLIAGVPDDRDVGEAEVSVEASDGRLAASRTFRVTVRNRPPSFGDVPRRRGRVGFSYRDTLRVHNLDGGSVRVTDGPPGLEVDGMALRWRPSAPGRWLVTVQAQDPHGGEATTSWEVEALPLPRVVVDEILADPPRGPEGDANGDGRWSGAEDEFIELLNVGRDTAAVGGLKLGPKGTSDAGLFRFPEGTAIPPGGRVLVFGGGTPVDFPCPVYVAGGRIGRGLSADGGAVALIDSAGPDTLIRAVYPGRGRGQSWTRHPDGGRGDEPVSDQGEDAFVLHGDLPGRGRFSPGRARPLLISLSVAAETTMAVGSRRPFSVTGVFNDGVQESVTGLVSVAASDTTVLRVEGVGRLTCLREGRVSVRAWFGEIEGVAEVRVIPDGSRRVVSAQGRPPSTTDPQPDDVLPPTLSGASPVRDTASVGSDYRLRAESLPGASLRWTIVEGPAWLAVEPTTGDLVGRPAGEGIFQVVLSGRDSTGQVALVVVTLMAQPESHGRGPPDETGSSQGDEADELPKKIRRRKGQPDSDVDAPTSPGDEGRFSDTGSNGTGPPVRGGQTGAGGPVLSPNYPNPFNNATVFHCRSPTPGRVEIYTLLGHCVRRWVEVSNGQASLVWDGRDESGRTLPSGIYFLVFDAGGVRTVRSMTLIR